MQLSIGSLIIDLYVKQKRLSFNEARKYIKYIYIKHARGILDSNLAFGITIKVLSSLNPYVFKKSDTNSFDVEKNIIALFEKNKKITFQSAIELLAYIDIEHTRGRLKSCRAYRYTIKALSSLKPNYIDEVKIYE